MKSFQFYHKDTGLLADFTYSASQPEVELNTPSDHVPIEGGAYDHLSQRVDLSGSEPVITDYQPPIPSPDHQWDEATRRWVLKPEVLAAKEMRMTALAQIRVLEAAQHRAVREVMLGDAAALPRLKEIDRQIDALRGQLSPSFAP